MQQVRQIWQIVIGPSVMTNNQVKNSWSSIFLRGISAPWAFWPENKNQNKTKGEKEGERKKKEGLWPKSVIFGAKFLFWARIQDFQG